MMAYSNLRNICGCRFGAVLICCGYQNSPSLSKCLASIYFLPRDTITALRFDCTNQQSEAFYQYLLYSFVLFIHFDEPVALSGSQYCAARSHKHDRFCFNEIFDNHEQVVFASEEKSGLKAIIAVHNAISAAMGGCRVCGTMPASRRYATYCASHAA